MMGVQPSYIAYPGRGKIAANEDEPLDDEARQELQRREDRVGREFEVTVARNRGMPRETVQRRFGRGRTLDAKRAVDVGMADRIATLEETIARLSGSDRWHSPRRHDTDCGIGCGDWI
jgi:ClpP class serine protease